MSLSNETVRAIYSANGATTAFAIPHDIIQNDSSEVEVYSVDQSTTPATETLQVEGALQDYTLTGASPPTTPFDTHVTFNSAPASGLKIVIQRKIALTQPTDLATNSAFPATTVETTLDRLVAEIQLLNHKIKRALKTRLSIPDASLDLSVPDPAASTFLRWNSAATALENATVVGSGVNVAASSTDNAVMRWDGTAGNTAQNSVVIIGDTGNVTGVAALTASGTVIGGTLNGQDLTASRATATDASKNLVSSATTATELGYLSGVTSAIQTQLDAKATLPIANTGLDDMAESTIKGRAAGAGTGDPTDLTATQATAILNAVVGDSGAGGTKGLVPAPAAGDAAANKFLHADGTFAVPAGSGITALTGDVTASGTGSVAATIANDAVTYAKMQNVSATDKLLGRSTAGSGDVEEIACTAAGRALLDDADASAQLTTLGAQPLDATLTALAAYNTNGLITQTAADTFTGRTVTGTANEITVTNGDGVSGNPTLSLPATIDLGGKTSFEIPNGTSPTVDAAGEIAIDTDADGNLIDQGLIVYHDGVQKMFVVAVDTLPSTDGHALTYDATNDKFVFEAQSGTGTSPSAIRLHTGNGFGSTNTKIRRFTTTVGSGGSDITYTDSAANGASFTVATAGIYSFTYTDEGDTGSPTIGLSVNSSELTTDLSAITAADRLVMTNHGNGNERGSISWTGYLAANDVVRAHTNSGTAGFVSAATNVNFTAVGPL